MEFRKLRQMGGGESAGVTLPKEELREMGFVSEGEIVEGYAQVERVSDSEFKIELVG
jgi:hypothetical protein